MVTGCTPRTFDAEPLRLVAVRPVDLVGPPLLPHGFVAVVAGTGFGARMTGRRLPAVDRTLANVTLSRQTNSCHKCHTYPAAPQI